MSHNPMSLASLHPIHASLRLGGLASLAVVVLVTGGPVCIPPGTCAVDNDCTANICPDCICVDSQCTSPSDVPPNTLEDGEISGPGEVTQGAAASFEVSNPHFNLFSYETAWYLDGVKLTGPSSGAVDFEWAVGCAAPGRHEIEARTRIGDTSSVAGHSVYVRPEAMAAVRLVAEYAGDQVHEGEQVRLSAETTHGCPLGGVAVLHRFEVDDEELAGFSPSSVAIWEVPVDAAGRHSVALQVKLLQDSWESDIVGDTLDLEVVGVNLPPTVTLQVLDRNGQPVPNANVREGDRRTLRATGLDREGAMLEYRWLSGPGEELEGWGTTDAIDWVPGYDVGPDAQTITVEVRDGVNLPVRARQTFQVQDVAFALELHDPAQPASPPASLLEGTEVELTAACWRDICLGDAVFYRFYRDDERLLTDWNSAPVFTWHLGLDLASTGRHLGVQVTTDPELGAQESVGLWIPVEDATVTLEVLDGAGNPGGSTTFTAGTLQILAAAMDPRVQASREFRFKRNGAVVRDWRTDPLWRWQLPDTGPVLGHHIVTCEVREPGQGVAAADQLAVFVEPMPLAIGLLGPESVEQGARVDWTASGVDPDGDPLLFKFVIDDDSAAPDAAHILRDWDLEPRLTWDVGCYEEGPHTLYVLVSDQFDEVNKPIRGRTSMAVSITDSPPTVSLYGDEVITVQQGSSPPMTALVEDLCDDETHYLRFLVGEGDTRALVGDWSATPGVVWHVANNFPAGLHPFTVEVLDVDPCVLADCGAGACILVAGTPTCSCDAPLISSGLRCLEPDAEDPCGATPSPCPADKPLCLHQGGATLCLCPYGMEEDEGGACVPLPRASATKTVAVENPAPGVVMLGQGTVFYRGPDDSPSVVRALPSDPDGDGGYCFRWFLDGVQVAPDPDGEQLCLEEPDSEFFLYQPAIDDVGTARTIGVIVYDEERNTSGEASFDFLVVDARDRPFVVNQSPMPGATGVADDTTPWVQFSEPMETASVEESFRLWFEQPSRPVAGSFSWSGDRTFMTYEPAELLASGRHGVMITDSALSELGIPLASELFTFEFTTLDRVQPTITSLTPQDGAANVSALIDVVCTFSEAMKTDVSEGAITLQLDGADVPFGLRWEQNARVVRITPLEHFRFTRTYSFTMSTNLLDLAGNPLAAGAHRIFTIAAADDKDGDGFGSGVDCDDNNPEAFPGQQWYADCDGDGFLLNSAVASCRQPSSPCLGGLPPAGGWEHELPATPDCDDRDPALFPGQRWHPDCDGDHAFLASPTVSCQRPAAVCSGAAPLGGFSHTTPVAPDCDDRNAELFPGQQWYADCDGDAAARATMQLGCRAPTTPCADGQAPDGGWGHTSPVPPDCDDEDGQEFPGQTWYPDGDGDGAGNNTADGRECDRAELTDVTGNDDCADDDPDRFPGAPELCDGIDNDCDDVVPTSEVDSDGDFYAGCVGWIGSVPGILGGSDCHDGDPELFPGQIWYPDCDADAFFSGEPETACMVPESPCLDGLGPDGGWGHTQPEPSDCDDEDALEFPGQLWYPDGDGDGHGNPAADGQDCARAGSTDVTTNNDCDDLDPDTFPGAPELCDLLDNDCNGLVGGDEVDQDLDRYLSCTNYVGTHPGVLGGDDCDDTDPTVFAGALELPDDDVGQGCAEPDLVAAAGDGIYVDMANPLCDDGVGSMTTPACGLVAGLDLAGGALPVFVASGTYPGPVVVDTDLFGGYEGSGWTRDIQANPTLIDAGGPGVPADVVVLLQGDPGGGATAFQGFTVNNHTDTGSSAAILAVGPSTIADNTSEANGHDSGARSIHVEMTDALIVRNQLTGSTAWFSAGILVNGGQTTAIGNTVVGCMSGRDCYGVGIEDGTVYLAGNTLSGGFPTFGTTGGGYVAAGEATLVGNFIHGGSSSLGGSGGFFVDPGATARMGNNIVDMNGVSGQWIAGVQSGGTLLAVHNTIVGPDGMEGLVVWGGEASVGNSIIFGRITLDGAPQVGLWHNDLFPPGGPGCMLFDAAASGCLTTEGDPSPDQVVEINDCSWPGCAQGTGGNISVPPSLDDNFRLTVPDDPCVDGAVNQQDLALFADYFGGPRVVDGNGDQVALPDVGAHELVP